MSAFRLNLAEAGTLVAVSGAFTKLGRSSPPIWGRNGRLARPSRVSGVATAEGAHVPWVVNERAALEAFIAREPYGLSLSDWKYLTNTFTFGSGATSEEPDGIIRQSLAPWRGVPDEALPPAQ
jgi:hypothetical protein